VLMKTRTHFDAHIGELCAKRDEVRGQQMLDSRRRHGAQRCQFSLLPLRRHRSIRQTKPPTRPKRQGWLRRKRKQKRMRCQSSSRDGRRKVTSARIPPVGSRGHRPRTASASRDDQTDSSGRRESKPLLEVSLKRPRQQQQLPCQRT
jgi:hypothetical protein